MSTPGMNIYVAPLQGFTEAPFRHCHASVYGAADRYYTPFLRIEHGEPRHRDMRDVTSQLNDNHDVVPQIIFRDIDEFDLLTGVLKEAGCRRVDLNMGCPFPPQVNKGRGAGVLRNKALLEKVAERIDAERDMTFSAKMRPGISDYDEWRDIVDAINAMRLEHVTVHPRVAALRYGGSVDMDAFAAMFSQLQHRVVYNGDIMSRDDAARIADSFPGLDGIMIGRGVLARPSLIAEMREGRDWSSEERVDHLLQLHAGIFQHYSTTLCGDAQVLSKIKPFWEYLEWEIGHKTAKMIKKATSLEKYEKAVASIG